MFMKTREFLNELLDSFGRKTYRALWWRNNLSKEVIQLGKQCAVQITGWTEDAEDVETEQDALDAIRVCIQIGIERNNELNKLRMSMAHELWN